MSAHIQQAAYRNQFAKTLPQRPNEQNQYCIHIKEQQKAFSEEMEQVKIQCKIEEKLQSQQVQGQYKETKEFMNNLSQNIAQVFNGLIFMLNKARSQTERKIRQEHRKQKGEVIDLIALAEKEAEDKKYEKKMKRLKPYERQYIQSKPKKPVSSFFIFYQQKSKQLSSKTSDPNSPKLSVLVAEAWKGMNQEQRRPYLEKADETRRQYNEDMKKYIEQHEEEIEQARHQRRETVNRDKKMREKGTEGQPVDQLDKRFLNRKLKGVSLRQLKLEQKKQYAHRPKAPVSSFFVFYQTQARNLGQKHNVSEGKKLSRLASEVWKQMTPEQRVPYEIKAKQNQQSYHEQMRQYRLNFPEQIQKRKQKISANMRRALKARKDTNTNSQNSPSSDNEDLGSSSFQESNSYHSEVEQKDHLDDLPVQVKKTKDNEIFPHKPKGSVCAFFQYYQTNMKKFMTPGCQKERGAQLVKRASVKWKTMTQKDRQVYTMMYKADHARFLKQMQEFKTSYPEQYKLYLKMKKRTKKQDKKERSNQREGEQKRSSDVINSEEGNANEVKQQDVKIPQQKMDVKVE